MQKKKQEKAGRGRLVPVLVAVVIVALVGVIIYLLVSRNKAPEEEQRSVLVTSDNVEDVLEEIEQQAEAEAVAPGYYTVTMNPTWHFTKGDEASYDGVVENSEANTNDVYFDIVLEEDESHVLYKSPIIPRGQRLTEIKLDEALSAGTYNTVVIYNLIDDKQNVLSTVRVTLTIIVEE